MAENKGIEVKDFTDLDDDEEWKDLVTDVDGFWNEETSPVVIGKVISITEMELAGRDTQVAVLNLTKPCAAVRGKGKDKEEIILEPGQAIGVVVKHKLADLPSMVDNQCEVAIMATNKIPVGNGRTMWQYRLKFKGRRAGFAAARAKPAEPGPSKKTGSKTDDDETIDNY